ncbi:MULTISPECIES: colicin E3-like toxin immunity protein [Pseudomonas]|uniref:colicin E3-like toxin immunity protein n=1 Tax=Pseudomonas TaxID=286 RepID=UPI000D200D82|nr:MULTISPECIES: colicin E3-like toxin immunity protein [Pseudomonas]AVX87966.1 cloacin [Pseudomonas koreensis]MBI6949579.1 cloacin [Pseudomonas koreensis]MCU7213872.1 cloacin immunity family protein [Pseudomonas sp. VE 196-7]
MGLRVRLEWYDKKSELYEGEELSKDFGDDGSVIESLGMPIENNVNNGGFDMLSHWADTLQPHFNQVIDLTRFDYQIAFVYRDKW